MKPHLLAGIGLAALVAGTAARAQDATTIVRHERHVETKTVIHPEVQVDDSAATPPTTQIQTRTVTRHRVVTHRGYHTTAVRHPMRRRHVVHRAVRHAAAVTDTTATTTSETDATRSVHSGVVVTHEPVLVDRKTVIHRDDDGVVTKRTRVTRTHPDGSSTTVVRKSLRDPTEPPPPPPPQPDPDNPHI